MKLTITASFAALILSCGAPKDTPKEVVTPIETTPEVIEIVEEPTEEAPVIIEGSVTANFVADALPFYAVVKTVDKNRGITTIRFEEDAAPNLIIKEAYGATLEFVRLGEFDRDLLLVRSVYKDPIFSKHYLYIYKDDQWKPVVDGFILHVDNIEEGVIPIEMHPDRPDQMIRKYSVFDLDTKGDTAFRWILNNEVTPILNN